MFAASMLIAFLQAAPAAPTTAVAPPAAPKVGPVVTLETSLGRIKIGLYREQSPITVDNFIKYVRGGHYDGTIFHRVIPDFMIQGGGFEPDLTERPARPPIRNEAKNGLRNKRGTIAMARTSDPNSASAQFFINVRDNFGLDYGIRGAGYAVFGEVVEGMEVVDKIVAVATTRKGPHEAFPVTPVVIKSARDAAAPAVKAAAPAAPKP